MKDLRWSLTKLATSDAEMTKSATVTSGDTLVVVTADHEAGGLVLGAVFRRLFRERPRLRRRPRLHPWRGMQPHPDGDVHPYRRRRAPHGQRPRGGEVLQRTDGQHRDILSDERGDGDLSPHTSSPSFQSPQVFGPYSGAHLSRILHQGSRCLKQTKGHRQKYLPSEMK